MDISGHKEMIHFKQCLKQIVLFSLCLISFIFGCSDHVSEEDKEAIIKTLVSGAFNSGEYVIFWDGTNDKNVTMGAGTYYVRLYSQTFTHQIEITALAGGAVAVNDSSYFFEGYQPLTQILPNYPDPFQIRSGTNIPFTLNTPATIELTVRDKE